MNQSRRNAVYEDRRRVERRRRIHSYPVAFMNDLSRKEGPGPKAAGEQGLELSFGKDW